MGQPGSLGFQRQRPPAAVRADPAPPWAPAVGWDGPAPPDCVLCASLTQVPDGCGGWEQPKPRVAGEPSLKLEGRICPGVQRPHTPYPPQGALLGPGLELSAHFPSPIGVLIWEPRWTAFAFPPSSRLWRQRLVKLPFLFSQSFMVFQKTG